MWQSLETSGTKAQRIHVRGHVQQRPSLWEKPMRGEKCEGAGSKHRASAVTVSIGTAGHLVEMPFLGPHLRPNGWESHRPEPSAVFQLAFREILPLTKM